MSAVLRHGAGRCMMPALLAAGHCRYIYTRPAGTGRPPPSSGATRPNAEATDHEHPLRVQARHLHRVLALTERARVCVGVSGGGMQGGQQGLRARAGVRDMRGTYSGFVLCLAKAIDK